MVAQLVPAPHPILSALTTAREALTAVRDVQPVFMSPVEKKPRSPRSPGSKR